MKPYCRSLLSLAIAACSVDCADVWAFGDAHLAPAEAGSRGSEMQDASATDAPSNVAPHYTPSAGATIFVDDFSRQDGSTIGNGWTQDGQTSFALHGGSVEQTLFALPAEDAVLHDCAAIDVELSASAVLPASPGAHDPEPSLFARARWGNGGTVLGYFAHAYGGQLEIFTIPSSGVRSLGLAPIQPPPAAGQRIRIYLRVVGTAPPHLEAAVLGADNGVLAQVSVDDVTTAPFAGGGQVGFGSAAIGVVWDDFKIVAP